MKPEKCVAFEGAWRGEPIWTLRGKEFGKWYDEMLKKYGLIERMVIRATLPVTIHYVDLKKKKKTKKRKLK